MDYLTLNGQWRVKQRGESNTIPATVPGCIHSDLLAAGTLEDPYYRDNEARQMWIGESDWVYSRAFQMDAEQLTHERIVLRCEGLDTLATVMINDTLVGQTNNQFRIWEFDVKANLCAGDNIITVCFDSTFPYIQADQEKRYLKIDSGGCRIEGGNRIRKSQCNYGWDWGPQCVTAGIWRPIALLAFDTARLDAVQIRQEHRNDGKVELEVNVTAEVLQAESLQAEITVNLDGRDVARQQIALQGDRASARLMIDEPRLWWPNGLGDQPLYAVRVELRHDDALLDAQTKHIGLRTLELDRHADQWGESFQFVVNGTPFFAKGANWIPADTFVSRVTAAQYEHLLKSAAEANMNMLRVWGGGIYEDDRFYELCDQYGICVWQDFMFACSAYPAFDSRYLENVRQEAIDQVKRLRHHPCIALWCGNNELEQQANLFIGNEPGNMTWSEYQALFDDALPDVVQHYDSARPYWPSSPHSPVGDRADFNNPTCGDAHLWDVWHGRKPFEWYRACEHRFNSEFGFQSFPEPAVVKSYTRPEDRNISSYIMEWHQRSPIGNDAIIQYLLSWFQLPTSFDMLLWTSQIVQGMAMKYAVEHWRRSMPRGMGTLYWQMNDCWPVASWASIDSDGNWKALHYMAREFYAPLLISALENRDDGSVEIHVTNDLREAKSGQIHWTLTDTDGKALADNHLACSRFAPGTDTKACLLQFQDHLRDYTARRLLLWLELVVEEQVVSRNLVYFARPKHLELRDPKLTTQVTEVADGAFSVNLSATFPALWVWPDLESVSARYSQRFFHLMPGKSIEVTVRPESKLARADFEERLRVFSLTDTYALQG